MVEGYTVEKTFENVGYVEVFRRVGIVQKLFVRIHIDDEAPEHFNVEEVRITGRRATKVSISNEREAMFAIGPHSKIAEIELSGKVFILKLISDAPRWFENRYGTHPGIILVDQHTLAGMLARGDILEV